MKLEGIGRDSAESYAQLQNEMDHCKADFAKAQKDLEEAQAEIQERAKVESRCIDQLAQLKRDLEQSAAAAEAQYSKKIREMEIRHRDELEHQMQSSTVQMDSIKTELTNTRASLEMAGKNLKTRQDEISRLETLVEEQCKAPRRMYAGKGSSIEAARRGTRMQCISMGEQGQRAEARKRYWPRMSTLLRSRSWQQSFGGKASSQTDGRVTKSGA